MPFDNPYFPQTFDVGTPGGGHIHFANDGTMTLYSSDGVTVIMTLTPAQGMEIFGPFKGFQLTTGDPTVGNAPARLYAQNDPSDNVTANRRPAVVLTAPQPPVVGLSLIPAIILESRSYDSTLGSLVTLAANAFNVQAINDGLATSTIVATVDNSSTQGKLLHWDGATLNTAGGAINTAGGAINTAGGTLTTGAVTAGALSATSIIDSGALTLTTPLFPNILFNPNAGGTSAQVIASTGTLNFDVLVGNTFQFRSGINGTAVTSIETGGKVTTVGPTAQYILGDQDGIGGDYFALYATGGKAAIWNSAGVGDILQLFENGNVSTIGSHFFQSPTYGGRFGAGNDSGLTSLDQIAFGYHNAQDSYRHIIQTMHDGGIIVNNRLSIWLWRPVDGPSGHPSLKALEIDATGNLVLAGTLLTSNGSPSFAGVTTSTSAAAGTASALPGSPAGYWTVTINGANKKLAYWN